MASIIKVDEIQKSNGDPFDFGGKTLIHRTLVTTESTQSIGTSWTTINGLEVTFTPQSANSVFRIDVRWLGEVDGGWDLMFGVSRDGTPLSLPSNPSGNAGLSAAGLTYHLANDIASTLELSTYFTYDEPAIASTVTYTAQVRANSTRTMWNNRTASSTTGFNYERGSCEIIVTEYA